MYLLSRFSASSSSSSSFLSSCSSPLSTFSSSTSSLRLFTRGAVAPSFTPDMSNYRSGEVGAQSEVYNKDSSTPTSSSSEHHYQPRPGFNAGTWIIFGALGLLGYGIISSLQDDIFALAKTKEPEAVVVEIKVPEYPEKPNPAGP